MTDILMPAMGNTIETARIKRWLVLDRSHVDANQSIVEAETDKCSVEIVAEESGILTIMVHEGDSARVGDVIATITQEDGASGRVWPPPPSKGSDTKKNVETEDRPSIWSQGQSALQRLRSKR